MQYVTARTRVRRSLPGPRLLITAYFTVLLIILATTVPTLVQTLHTLDRQQSTFDPTSAAVTQVLIGALNQETGVRGYALSGNAAFLEPYTLGTSQYASAIYVLQRADLGPDFAVAVTAMATSFQRWHVVAAGVIADMRVGNISAGRALSVQSIGKDRFDRFRNEQTELSTMVERDVTSGRQSLHHDVEVSLIVLGAAVLLGVAVGVGMWLWWRVSGRRSALHDRELADRAVLIQSAIDASSESIFAKDREGRHLLANRARARAVAGGDANAVLIGHTVEEFLPAPIATDIRSKETEIMTTGTERQFEEVLPQPNGPRTFAVTKSPLLDADGQIAGVVGVARDVTDERALLSDRESLYQLEHRIAGDLQRAMLGNPSIDDARIEACARYRPAIDEMYIGGDWYDILPAANDRIALIVGDAVGHGIESATAMGQLRSALAVLAHIDADPGVMLEVIDEFAQTVPNAHSATCLLVLIDPGAAQLVYSCAGHIPPLIVPVLRHAQLLGDHQDPPLTVPRSQPRRSVTVSFPVGSLVVLCTDGLVERRDEGLEVGLRRLRASAAANRHLSVERLSDKLLDDLIVPEAQRDDVAVVVARLASQSPGEATVL